MAQAFTERQKERLENKLEEYQKLQTSERDGIAEKKYKKNKKQTSTKFIRAALERIEEGTYRKCIDCGEEIKKERHETVPGATRCITCQRKQEEL